MRRFHNPRFAPESLERKLSPSGVAPFPVAAEVYAPAAQASNLLTPDDDGDGDGDPPVTVPTIPTGPAQPA